MIVENSMHHRPRKSSSDQKGVWKTAARISTTDLFPRSLPKLISHPTSSLTSFERPVIHIEYLLPSFLENKARRRSQKSLSSFLRLKNILIFTLLIKLKLKICARICTGCLLNSKNSRKFATSPSPALGCYWLYKKLPAIRSDCTLALHYELWRSLTAM